MKTELKIAKKRIIELEALVKKLSSNLLVSGSISKTSKEMENYEFNMHRHWIRYSKEELEKILTEAVKKIEREKGNEIQIRVEERE